MAKGFIDIVLDQLFGSVKPKKKRKPRRRQLTVMQLEMRSLRDLHEEDRQRKRRREDEERMMLRRRKR